MEPQWGPGHEREQEVFHRRGGSELALEGCVGVDHLEDGRHSKERLNVLKFMVKDSGFSLAPLSRLCFWGQGSISSPVKGQAHLPLASPAALLTFPAHLPSGIHSTGAGCSLKPWLFPFSSPSHLVSQLHIPHIPPIHPRPAVRCRCHTQICRGLHNPCRALLTGISKPSAVVRTPPFASPE